ncbi:MAG: hypothetical protein HZY73_10695 [Micropruina sp.]|nr:MAG: hypothetical protein HZY73_10695 [Micropruina sp.]
MDVARNGQVVRFSWRYTNGLASDEFWYYFGDEKTYRVTKETFVQTKASPGAQVCLSVKVHRASGDDASDYTRKCTS